MALKDVLTVQAKARPANWIDLMEKKLSPEDFQWLMECLKNKTDFSGTYIAQKMTQAGYPVSPTTINLLRKSL